MQNFRTASQKMEKEHSSWHVRPAGDLSNVRTSDAIMTPTKPQPSRSDSRNSVNFSYPTVFRPQSPPISPTSSAVSPLRVASPRSSTAISNSSRGLPSNSHAQGSQKLVYDANSRRIVPESQIEEAIEYQVKQAAEKPTKKRRDGASRKEGHQLAKGTMTRPKGTSVDESKNLHEPSEREQPVPISPSPAEMLLQEEPTPKSVSTTERSYPHKPVRSHAPSGSVFESPPSSTHKDPSEKVGDAQPSHSVQTPATTIQGEATANGERLRKENYPQPSQSVLGALDAVPTRQSLFTSSQPQQSSQKPDNHEAAQDNGPPSTVERSEWTETGNDHRAMIPENKPVVVLAAENGGVSRSSSSSPARQARFAPKPAEKLAVRHDPLPRSASPIKSAMKHTNPIAREPSPSDNATDPSVSSAISPDQKDDFAISRKKSARVSFDDHGTVIVEDSPSEAEEESPATQSPQAPKRTWFSNIGRSKKKEIALDDDEVMKPRPALPSFGSIREKKTREQWERPLVRPHEPANSSTVSSSPELRPQSSSTLNDSETTEEPQLGQSSDHAIGALLAQDQTSRIAANISRFREPLPPVVTSIEGYGYSSDSSQGSDNEEHPDSPTEAALPTMSSSVLGTQLTEPDIDDSPGDKSTAVSTSIEASQTASAKQQDIPKISVIQPSPMTLEHGPSSDGVSTSDYFDVPGGFPEGDSDSNNDSPSNSTKDTALKDSAPSSTTIFEPTPANIEPGQAEILPQTTLDTLKPLTGLDDTSKDDSDESIYSDAYEDIPDIDPNGFVSLDAVVESPAKDEPTPTLLRNMISSPTAAITGEPKEGAISESPSAKQARSIIPSQNADEWEQAKIFWRSLTAEKRRQLELEVAEEAGVEGDREEVSQPVRRSSTKKKSSELGKLSAQTIPSRGDIAQPESHMQLPVRHAQTAKPSSIQSQTGMRRTLRSNGVAQSIVKPSTRQAITTQAPSPTTLVASRNKATKPRPHSSALPAPMSRPNAQVKPSLQRRDSDASDSSFKRHRHPTNGNFAFRKTMRQTSPTQPHHDSTKGSGRFSLRSLSPVGSTVHREPNTGPAASSTNGMRRTLRSTSESGYEGKRSSIHFPLFTRSTKSPPKSSRWSSRLGDSSDEDEGASVSFHSRIQDSSDEDETRPSSSMESKPSRKSALHSSTTTSRLSRPAPVPELEEDSPDLPDSDDDFMPSPLQSVKGRTTTGDFANRPILGRSGSGAIGTSTLGQSRSGRGALTSAPISSALPTKERRSSLLSILRRNVRGDQGGKIQRSDPIDSAARRDTKLERDPRQLKDLRSEQPSSPKLHKRTPISRGDSGGPALASSLLGRSATASAVVRPAIGDRRSFSLGAYPNNDDNDTNEFENASVDSPGFPKKKKFGALRRMFKLDG